MRQITVRPDCFSCSCLLRLFVDLFPARPYT